MDPENPNTDTSAVDQAAEANLRLADSQKKVEEQTTKTNTVKEKFVNTAKEAKNRVDNLTNSIEQLYSQVKDGTAFTDNQAAAVARLTTRFADMQKMFTQVGTFDANKMFGFSAQYNQVSGFIKNIIDTGAKAATPFSKIAEQLGAITGLKIPTSVLKLGAEAVDKYVVSQFQAADAALRFQNAIIANAAKTGELGNVLNSAGTNLEKLNYVLHAHNEIISTTATATGISRQQAESYYAELSKIPGALRESANSADGAEMQTSLLTASIQLAVGTGRNYTDVVRNMKTAYDNYKLSGQPALEFTARISELSNKFGVELQDVESYLSDVSRGFGMMGNNAESSAKVINNYIRSFQDIGLSAKQAMSLVSGMTQQVQNLTIAQKAFLSGQSGGPGGLMGAFQIDKMLREGKLDQVMDMTRKQIQKQFGEIVTLEQAATSPQAAAQLAKQMTILKQGPLGGMVKTDAEAYRMLEALKARDTQAFKGITEEPLSKTVAEDYQKQGVEIQKKSYTELTRISNLLASQASRGGIDTLTTTQLTISAGAGVPISKYGKDLNQEMRQDLVRDMREGEVSGGQMTERYYKGLSKGGMDNFSGVEAAKEMRILHDYGDRLKNFILSPVRTLNMMMDEDPIKKAKDDFDKIQGEELRKLRTKLSSKKISQENFNKEINKLYSDREKFEESYGIKFNKPISYTESMQKDTKIVTEKAATKEEISKKNIEAAPKFAVDPIDVTVKGFCIDCAKKIEMSKHSRVLNPAIEATGK
ncbi:MAG: phage tail tape measure protein [Chitinophagales bacterium]|nr:phage tail tape measure protein [Chitinophagales bacterium]